MKKSTKDSRLASKYRCDERTIRRWRRDGAPFDKPAEMRAWLATRKNIPPGTAALLEESRREAMKPAATAAVGTPPRLGVGPALSRLEAAEARAHAAFVKA